jgi:hypothetical protein
MFGWWATTFVWVGGLGYCKARVRNWCRAQSSLEEAGWVWVAAPSREQNLSVKASRAVQCIARVYQAMVDSSGFEETVPVQVRKRHCFEPFICF